MNLRQFKLTNNDEVIADVIEQAEEGDLVIKSALKIFQIEDTDQGIRYYSFKPWLSFNDNLDEIAILNIGHIIVETAPSDMLVNHYVKALFQISRETEKAAVDLDEIERDTANMDDDELRDYMLNKLAQVTEENGQLTDSSNSNVLSFRPPNSKLH